MLELIFAILGEALAGLIGSFILDLIPFTFARHFLKGKNPIVVVVGYGLIGAILGGISLSFAPFHLIRSHVWRIVNILLTPVLTGLLLAMWKNKKSHQIPPIYKNRTFYCGFFFALCLLAIRLMFAK
jgi:uncharacterized YccA/Bax inhibitor family protein